MQQPSWREVIFSIKTFGAAMLALYIAFWLNLTQPSWAMLTAFVVSQPIAGMVVAKSLFRVVGTVVGATIALLLVASFAQSGPVFLTLLALWIGAGTFTSVLLRDAPAAYGAMLSGYTAAIVGIPAALAPETAFDYASGRCIEILIGIGCATIVSQVVFPRTAGDALQTSVDLTMKAVARWVGDVLRGESQDDKVLADQRKMIADVIALDALRVFSTFDTPKVRAAGNVARHLQGQFVTLLSMLVSIHDRMGVLRERETALLPTLQPLLNRTAALLDRDDPLVHDPAVSNAVNELKQEIERRLPTFEAMALDHRNILVRTVLLRVRDVLDTWHRVLALRNNLFSGTAVSLQDTGLLPEAAPSSARYRDYTLAIIAGAISTTAVLVTSAFWLTTGWSQGSSAVIFSGIICSILASLDDPAAAAGNFLKMTALSAIAAAIYLFAVLPWIDGFGSLVAVLLPFYLPFGILLAMPGVGTRVTPLGLNLAALLGLTNNGVQTDFATFANSTLALLAGIVSGILMFRLLRPLGVEWTIRRIRQSALRDLERLAEPENRIPRPLFESRMFDRINALFSRIDMTNPEQRDMIRAQLTGLRIGLNVIALKAARADLHPPAADAVTRFLAALSNHFGRLRSGIVREGTLPELDHAVGAVLEYGGDRPVEEVLASLVAIGSALHRHAGFFAVSRPLMPQRLSTEALA